MVGPSRRAPAAAVLVAAALLAALLLAALAAAEVSQKGGVRVSVTGKMSPTRLPRQGSAPIGVAVAGQIASTNPGGPPQLETIAIAINRHGHLDTEGLPRCRLGRIDPSTTAEALAACRSSLIGEGRFSADVKIPEQSPFPSRGKVLAFNGRLRGRPAIFAHIYGTEPVPTSYVLPFSIGAAKGTYGTLLEASFPQVTGEWGFVTGIEISLDRTYSAGGQKRSYLAAGCPAPRGFPGVTFPLVRTSFAFAGGLSLSSTLNRSCKVAG
jgi:hypothetical protein